MLIWKRIITFLVGNKVELWLSYEMTSLPVLFKPRTLRVVFHKTKPGILVTRIGWRLVPSLSVSLHACRVWDGRPALAVRGGRHLDRSRLQSLPRARSHFPRSGGQERGCRPHSPCLTHPVCVPRWLSGTLSSPCPAPDSVLCSEDAVVSRDHAGSIVAITAVPTNKAVRGLGTLRIAVLVQAAASSEQARRGRLPRREQ